MNESLSKLAGHELRIADGPQDAAGPAVAGPVISASTWGFGTLTTSGQLLATLCTFIERLCGVVLAVDVLVVFISVILRYFVHHPVDWAEEIARGLMVTMVFLGGATVLARRQHVNIDFFRALLPQPWRAAALQTGYWVIAGTAGGPA